MNLGKVVAIDYHGKTDKSFLVNLPDVYIVHQILVPVYYKPGRCHTLRLYALKKI